MSDAIQPSDTIDQLIEAFNRHEIEEVMSFISDDAQVFAFPSTELDSSSPALRAYVRHYFEDPSLKLRRFSSMVFEQMVVVIIVLRRSDSEGVEQVSLGFTFEVRGTQISKAWIMPGPEFDPETKLPKFHRT